MKHFAYVLYVGFHAKRNRCDKQNVLFYGTPDSTALTFKVLYSTVCLPANYWYLKTGPLYNDTAAEGMVESLSFRYKFYPCKKYSVFYYHENRKAALEWWNQDFGIRSNFMVWTFFEPRTLPLRFYIFPAVPCNVTPFSRNSFRIDGSLNFIKSCIKVVLNNKIL